jgi:hypothetical protein
MRMHETSCIADTENEKAVGCRYIITAFCLCGANVFQQPGTPEKRVQIYFEAQPQNISHHALSTTASAATNHTIVRPR